MIGKMYDHDIMITSLNSRYRRTNARVEIIHKCRVYFCTRATHNRRVHLAASLFDAGDINLDGNEITYTIKKDSLLFKTLNNIGAKLTKDTVVHSDRIFML